MNNEVAKTLAKVAMSIKSNVVNVCIETTNGHIYKNIVVDDFDEKGVYFNDTNYVCYDKISKFYFNAVCD